MSYGLPDVSKYNAAIQDVKNLNIPFLQNAKYDKNSQGLPFSDSGRNAIVYRFRNNLGGWAVRCFLSYDESQTERYAKLSQFFIDNRILDKYFINFQYHPRGIRVEGTYYPVLTMRWVDGFTLDKYISSNYRDPRKINVFLINFLRMLAFLRLNNIAHGDLQHGNILVLEHKPYLIDYDGMFIPDFKNMNSVEMGHPDYQHPLRTRSDFSDNTDNFSAWIIFASLVGVILEPRLWDPSLRDLKNDGSRDRLLFCHEDFLNPDRSDVLRKLLKSQHPQLRALGDLLRSFIISPHIIPSPADFIRPTFTEDGSWIAQFLSSLANPNSIQKTKEAYLAYDTEPEFFDKVVNCSKNVRAPLFSTSSHVIPIGRNLDEIDKELELFEKAITQSTKSPKTNKGPNATNQSVDPDYLFKRGCWLLMTRNYLAAIDALQNAIALRPNHPESHLMLGQAHEKNNEYDQAMAHYQIAINQRPDYSEAHYAMGEFVRKKKRKIRASLHHYQNALRYKPDYFEALLNLGRAYNSLKDYDSAIRCLERALSLARSYKEREAVHKSLNTARLRGWS